MKTVVLIVLMLCNLIGFGQDADSLFVQANKLYQQENYEDALKLYEEIETLDEESWALYYNMGNIFYKKNQVAPAVYYFEKALVLSPDNKDVLFNLQFTNQMILDNIEPLPKSFGQRLMDGIVLKITYENWAKVSVGLAFLFALLFLMYHFSYSTGRKRFYFITSILTVLFVTTSLFFAYRNQHYVNNNKEAIIFSREAEVKNAPTNTSDTYFELHEGTKVLVLESLDEWKKIKIADGKIGWIEQKNLKEI